VAELRLELSGVTRTDRYREKHRCAMKIVTAGDVTLDRAWAAVDLARIADATVRLHWTDEPYVWHTNDGVEVFVVLDGAVDMHYRDEAGTHVTRLEPGRIFVAEDGDEHVAHPVGTARILVIEQAGSI